MNRTIVTFIILFTMTFSWQGCRKPEKPSKIKYCFLFVGDGMGVAQVNLTEAYLAAIHGNKGFEKLSFTGFPVTG